MRAISLWQPWATLIAIGAKKIETRSWGTDYRGPIAIHAAKKSDSENRWLVHEEAFRSALIAADVLPTLPLGVIVAVAELVACVEIHSTPQFFQGFDGRIIDIPPAQPERSFGDYTPGRFAWVLDKVRPLTTPIAWRGSQKWFNVPDDLDAMVRLLEQR